MKLPQFSLRELFLLVLVCACLCWGFAERLQHKALLRERESLLQEMRLAIRFPDRDYGRFAELIAEHLEDGLQLDHDDRGWAVRQSPPKPTPASQP
jgi:hypothetical protein